VVHPILIFDQPSSSVSLRGDMATRAIFVGINKHRDLRFRSSAVRDGTPLLFGRCLPTRQRAFRHISSSMSGRGDRPCCAIDGETTLFAFRRKNPTISKGVIFDGVSDGMGRDEKFFIKEIQCATAAVNNRVGVKGEAARPTPTFATLRPSDIRSRAARRRWRATSSRYRSHGRRSITAPS
jgi:hypothetical protein